VLGPDRSLVRAEQPAFEQRGGAVHRRLEMCAASSLSVITRPPVRVAVVGQDRVVVSAVGADRRSPRPGRPPRGREFPALPAHMLPRRRGRRAASLIATTPRRSPASCPATSTGRSPRFPRNLEIGMEAAGRTPAVLPAEQFASALGSKRARGQTSDAVEEGEGGVRELRAPGRVAPPARTSVGAVISARRTRERPIQSGPAHGGAPRGRRETPGRTLTLLPPRCRRSGPRRSQLARSRSG
jgi:hypothetical protein